MPPTDSTTPQPQPPQEARHAEATRRNRDPILAVLRRILPDTGLVLELASGTGEHAVHFAPRLAPRIWQPSDPDPAMRDSIRAWATTVDCGTLRPPLDLDVTRRPEAWPLQAADAMVAVNLVHIAPWEACLGLMAGAGRLLAPGGPLALYGPFKVDGRHTAGSNAAFDASLRARDPAWGVRDRDAVAEAASAAGLDLVEAVAMPANNQTLVFRRRGGAHPIT